MYEGSAVRTMRATSCQSMSRGASQRQIDPTVRPTAGLTLLHVDHPQLSGARQVVKGLFDRFVAALVQQVATPKLLVVNKIDRAGKPAIVEHLATAARDLGDFDAYLPLSARTGDGIAPLLGEIESRLPEGPRYYPEGVVTDQPETFVAAELVREKLLAVARDELPHSITVSVEELEDIPDADADVDDPDQILRLRADISVERDSQKGIVIEQKVIPGANHFFDGKVDALMQAIGVYLDKRLKTERKPSAA